MKHPNRLPITGVWHATATLTCKKQDQPPEIDEILLDNTRLVFDQKFNGRRLAKVTRSGDTCLSWPNGVMYATKTSVGVDFCQLIRMY